MKMASRWVVYALLPVVLTAAIDNAKRAINNGKAGGLRGQSKYDPQVQSVSSHYFGLTFEDSPFHFNPWVTMKSARVVDDLDPIAPYDRLDRTLIHSVSGAAPVEPGKRESPAGYTQPDYIPPYRHPKPFPQEEGYKQRDGIMVPIGDRTVLAHEDRLRLPGMDNQYLNPLGMYPLVAPADKISPGPVPVAGLDTVPKDYGRFFAQTMRREFLRQQQKALTDAFERVDTDKDNAVSSVEYDAEVKGRQKKTDSQAEVLWKRYHVSADPDMTQQEFEKLAKDGFDLGQEFVNRTDISAILEPPQTADVGFWGGGAACPEGKYIKGVQIKVKPDAETGDNTALNCVKFKCEDGTMIQTAEGPDGDWTDWAECLPGQTIHSVSVRVQQFRRDQDNSGINDLMFQCRSPGHEDVTTLKFGKAVPPQEQQGYVFVNGEYVKRSATDVDDKAVVVGNGTAAREGGWSEDLLCGTNAAICGAQGRLNYIQNATDNIGVTNVRFFCCSKDLDCSGPCKEATSTDCKSCQTKALVVKR